MFKDNVGWEENYQGFRKYLITYFKLPTSDIVVNGTNIKSWYSNQKRFYKNGTLTKERIRKLEKLSKEWYTSKGLFEYMYKYLCSKKYSSTSLCSVLGKEKAIKYAQEGVFTCKDYMTVVYKEGNVLNNRSKAVLNEYYKVFNGLYPELNLGMLKTVVGSSCDYQHKIMNSKFILKYFNSCDKRKEFLEAYNESLKDLNYQDVTVLKSVLLDEETLTSLSYEWGVSKERVRCIEGRAMQNFKRSFKKTDIGREMYA